jgi:ligand-binding sensor domain-containing protein
MRTTIFTSVFSMASAVWFSANASSWTNYDPGNSPLPSNTVNALLADGDAMWVGTDEGLGYFDGATWTIYDEETSSLPSNTVYDLHQDVAGDIWIATDAGIAKFDEGSWEIFNVSNSALPTNEIRAIDSDSEGSLWIGTWGEGLVKKSGNDWMTYTTANSDLPSNGIFSVRVDHLGHPWVGTYNGGVCVFNGQDWTIYNTSNSMLPQNHARTIDFDADGTTWVGTDNGLVHMSTEADWDVYTAETVGHSFHAVRWAERGNDGMYFATDAGVMKYSGGTYSFITTQNSGLTTNNIRSLAFDEEGNLWIGTANKGVLVFMQEGSVDVKEPLKSDGTHLEVFPNPVYDRINFILPFKHDGITEVTIVDAMGKEVYRNLLKTHNGTTYNVDLGHLKPGNYILMVTGNEQRTTQRIVKI